MTATHQRDQASSLAKSSPAAAIAIARGIDKPWFRAQALAWVARFTDEDPVAVAGEAAEAAKECEDRYQQTAVRAWEVAALAERGYTSEARNCLSETLTTIRSVEPTSSRSEALMLLLQAAFAIDRDDALCVHEMLKSTCPAEEHWRCKRAHRDAAFLISGEQTPRPFFW